MNAFRTTLAATALGLTAIATSAAADGMANVQTFYDLLSNPGSETHMAAFLADFPGVVLGVPRVSLPGAVGFQLTSDIQIAQPQANVGGREFAHLHPDGSLHASLHPDTARAAVEAGWAVAHPWANQRTGREGFVVIHTPITEAELDVVLQLVRGSYTYISGEALPET